MEISISKLLPPPKEKERSDGYSQDELLPHPKEKEMGKGSTLIQRSCCCASV